MTPLFISDIWQHILANYLPPESIEALGTVNRLLHELASSEQTWEAQIQWLIREYGYALTVADSTTSTNDFSQEPLSAKARFRELYPNQFSRNPNKSSTEPLQRLNVMCPGAKMIFLGCSGVGKTALNNRILSGKFAPQVCCNISAANGTFPRYLLVSVAFFSEKEPHVRTLLLQQWDTAGQERFQSFDCLAQWLDYAQSYDKTIPIVLVGTKKDLKQKEVIPAEDIRDLCRAYRMPYFETSSKTNEGVDRMLEVAVSLAFPHWKAKAAEAELLERIEAEMATRHMRELEVSTWRGWILSKAKSALGLFGS